VKIAVDVCIGCAVPTHEVLRHSLAVRTRVEHSTVNIHPFPKLGNP
jgi:hypothetical protein